MVMKTCSGVWQMQAGKVKKWVSFVGAVLFIIGVLLGGSLNLLLAWSDIEANFYFGADPAGDLPGMQCPLILSADEVGTVSVSLTNPRTREMKPIIEFTASSRGLFRQTKDQPTMAAEETREFKWNISRADIDFGIFAMAKVFVFSAFYQPNQLSATCGILWLNLPGLSGVTIYLLWVALSVVFIVGGWLMWYLVRSPSVWRTVLLSRGMAVLGIAVLVNLPVTALGWWELGFLLLILTVLIATSLVGYVILSEEKE